MLRCFLVAALLPGLSLSALCQDAPVQSLPAKLAAVTSAYSLNAAGALEAVVKVAGDFRLPMGIECIKVASNTAPFTRSWRDTTPSAILEDIVKAYPQYQFEVGNGVVHVFPVTMKGNRADVLNARIGMFEVHDQLVSSAAYWDLAARVRKITEPPDPNGEIASMAGNIISGLGDGRVTFRIEDATVRDVLDKLCLSAGLNIWVVAYPPEPSMTRGGFFKTISLRESAVRNDRDFIPSWQFLPWGGRVAPRY
jgi:hypothetical protein